MARNVIMSVIGKTVTSIEEEQLVVCGESFHILTYLRIDRRFGRRPAEQGDFVDRTGELKRRREPIGIRLRVLNGVNARIGILFDRYENC